MKRIVIWDGAALLYGMQTLSMTERGMLLTALCEYTGEVNESPELKNDNVRRLYYQIKTNIDRDARRYANMTRM